MTQAIDDLQTLIKQLQELLATAPMDAPTPCPEWNVADLANHLVATTRRFASAVRGEQVDWSAGHEAGSGEPANRLGSAGDELLAAYQNPVEGANPDWQCAEYAVHTFDLATAMGHPTHELDQAAAARGGAFMRAQLTAELRGAAFGPEQQPPRDADEYQRIAAFAGRRVL